VDEIDKSYLDILGQLSEEERPDEPIGPQEEDDDWPSEATYVLFAEEPGMDDIKTKAGDSLDKLFDKFKIYPVTVDNNPILYLGRFELKKYGEALQYNEAVFRKGKVAGFMDFLSGFPMECTEMMAIVGEISSRPDLKAGELDSVPGGDGVVPSFPLSLFAGYADDKIVLNFIYLPTDNSQTIMVKGLSGEPEPGLRWWVRYNFLEDLNGSPLQFPYPGEFLGLAVRLMPDRFWDKQKSNPFLFSGNWMDTIYYTSGIIKEILEPTADTPYPTYTVQWRKDTYTPVRPTDFTEYKVGDRVTLLKDVETTKTSQLWKDDDMEKFGKWVIAPLSFYNINPDEDN
jgi:hypothetical protein